MRHALILLALLAAPPLAGPARGDGLPPPPPGGRYEGIEVRLRPESAALAWRGRAGATGPLRALGSPALDALAARRPGARFSAVFPAEPPRPTGTTGGDLAAFYRLDLPAGEDLSAVIAELRALPEVASAEPIPVVPVSRVPNDSLWSISTWFDQPSGRDVEAPAAWDLTTGDSTLTLAILDTGVLTWHPDLAGTVAGASGNLWVNAIEAAGAPGVDDDGNGYIDDVRGWDFVARTSATNIPAGEDWRDEDPDPSDFAGHGTKVAGIAGALTDNAIGVAGTAWRVRLLPLRMGWAEAGAPNGLVDMAYAAAAIRYATRAGTSVINCSFETAPLASLTAAVEEAIRAGVVIVTAAGNNGTTSTELQVRDDVLAVGAVNAGDVVAAFSNRGDYVDLCAPGVDVASTWVSATGADSIGLRTPAYDRALDGTSFASPFVAAAALLVQAGRRADGLAPLAPVEMVHRLRETADDIAAQNPGDGGYGTGRLNLLRALTDPPGSFAMRTRSRTVGPAVVMRTKRGLHQAAVVTNSSRLLVLSLNERDTLVDVPLPGRPARQLAAAAWPGAGIALFAGTLNGRVAGYALDGSVLPGWPVSDPGGLVRMTGGPAIGDLDGDGAPEVVCGGDDGSVWAWRADGSVVDGFPVTLAASGLAGAVALAELDGAPGVEIVALDLDGWVHVLNGAGAAAPGWPRSAGGAHPNASPVVGLLEGSPAVLVPAGGAIRAWRGDGSVYFQQSLPPGAVAVQDPALADLDGDGHDDLIVPWSAGATHGLFALDRGPLPTDWTVSLPGGATGPPVVGPLDAGGLPGLLVMRAGALGAYGATGLALPSFPKPGGGGPAPTLLELDGDGRTEVVAGTGPDSLLYVYDAGAATWGDTARAWLTPRGDAARTGARGGPALPAVDDFPPAAITDLAADSLAADAMALRWTAVGDDGMTGRAAGHELHLTALRTQAASFEGGLRIDVPVSDTAGTPERRVIGGLTPGTTYYLSVRARDAWGNVGTPSDALVVTLPRGPAVQLAPTGVAALRARTQPARPPVELLWQAGGAVRAESQAIGIFDVTGRLRREIAVGADSAGIARWDGRDRDGRRVEPGLYFARLKAGAARAEARLVVLP